MTRPLSDWWKSTSLTLRSNNSSSLASIIRVGELTLGQ